MNSVKNIKIDLKGSLQSYKSIVCNKKIPDEKLMPVMYQGVSLYLNYGSKDSQISKYIIQHINKPENKLIIDLLKTFPQYGLGDLQYKMLINNLKAKLRN